MNKEITAEAIGSVPSCKTCGSERVVKKAWACFNPESGLWELETVSDQAHCQSCEEETALVWSRQDAPPHQKIRELNDRFRTKGQGTGSIMLTHGIQELGSAFAVSVMSAVRSFDDFSDDNDPWGEHDFGAFTHDGEKIFWKLDYYDPSLTAGSENPANEGLTHRVLTIMLASEY